MLYRKKEATSLPYFGVQLSCVCLMFADRKKLVAPNLYTENLKKSKNNRNSFLN